VTIGLAAPRRVREIQLILVLSQARPVEPVDDLGEPLDLILRVDVVRRGSYDRWCVLGFMSRTAQVAPNLVDGDASC